MGVQILAPDDPRVENWWPRTDELSCDLEIIRRTYTASGVPLVFVGIDDSVSVALARACDAPDPLTAYDLAFSYVPLYSPLFISEWHSLARAGELPLCTEPFDSPFDLSGLSWTVPGCKFRIGTGGWSEYLASMTGEHRRSVVNLLTRCEKRFDVCCEIAHKSVWDDLARTHVAYMKQQYWEGFPTWKMDYYEQGWAAFFDSIFRCAAIDPRFQWLIARSKGTKEVMAVNLSYKSRAAVRDIVCLRHYRVKDVSMYLTLLNIRHAFSNFCGSTYDLSGRIMDFDWKRRIVPEPLPCYSFASLHGDVDLKGLTPPYFWNGVYHAA
jgi:hypothetical protein